MKALSIRSPWWWYILHNGKDIENRDWPTRFRGRVLIHASKWWNMEEIGGDFSTADRIAVTQHRDSPTTVLTMGLRRGHIVGSVEIVDCVSASDSPWFFGDYGFVLRDPVAFAHPIPFRGALGFFDVPNELIDQRMVSPNSETPSPKEAMMSDVRWECQCGATGWMTLVDRSLAGLVRQARREHKCADPDIEQLETRAEYDRRMYRSKLHADVF